MNEVRIQNIIENIDEEQFLLEMANLSKRMTGLPMNIYVSSKDSVRDRHGPRIKVMSTHHDRFNKETLTSVSISRRPVDLHGKLTQNDFAQVAQFIQQNYQALLALWNNEIDIGQLINVLQRTE